LLVDRSIELQARHAPRLFHPKQPAGVLMLMASAPLTPMPGHHTDCMGNFDISGQEH
jgi:hypothetical protein